MSEAMFHERLVHSNRIIYTPSAFARSSLLHLQETGTLHAAKVHTSRREGLASYLFFIVKHGSGTLTWQHADHPLREGDCVFIDCMQPYAHQPNAHDLWELQWVHFNGPAMAGVYAKYQERSGNRPIFHTGASAAAFSQLLTEMYTVAESDSHVRDMLLNERLSCLLTLVMSQSWRQDEIHTGAKKQSIQLVKAYLDEHYQEHVSLDQLSNLFYINKYYLTRVFREQYGTTILSYLDHVRVSHAKHLLRFTSLTAEEIGIAVGIDEPAYFNRVFKKVEGFTPGEYRRSW